MMAVPVNPVTGSPTGKPQLLFEKPYLDYDVAPDGRFLMIKATAEEQAPQPIRVIVNWATDTVRRTSPNR